MAAKLERTAGPGQAVLDRIAALGGDSVGVGTSGTYRDPDDPGADPIELSTLLLIHEFGLGVPQRSIVRAVLASRSVELAEVAGRAAKAIAQGADPATALPEVGRWLSEAFQARLREGLQPLDPDTIEPGRVSDRPLQRTGQILALLQAIGFNRG